MKTPLKYTLIITGLLILAAFTIAACSLPTQGAETNQSEIAKLDTATGETSLPVIDPTLIPIPEEEIIPEEVNEIEVIEAEVKQDTLEEPAITTAPVNTDNGPTGITDAEKAGLVYMREEEKLAHDVYLALYDLWGLQLFQNIARSEEAHTGAVKRLLDRFIIPDPADQSPPGIFQDQTLQALYDQLVDQGANSLGDSLKVGAVIEEIDILDLQTYLLDTTNPDIRRVYENLLRGSENHLRAFTSTLLQQTGETYVPQYMDLESFKSIVTEVSSNQRGNNRRRP